MNIFNPNFKGLNEENCVMTVELTKTNDSYYETPINSNSIEDIEDENTCESIEFEIHKKFPDKLEDFKRIFYLLISNDIQLESIKEEIAKAQ